MTSAFESEVGGKPLFERFTPHIVRRLSKSEPWRKAMETHGWYDAYAPSATFRKDMEREIALYTKIMAELGLLKEPAKP